LPSSVPGIFTFSYLLSLKAESTAWQAAPLGRVAVTITEKESPLPAGSAWTLKPIFITIFI